jgi:S1-C subfamily serine protease
MFVDILILLGAVFAAYRGVHIGFVRQLCSTAGFFIGLLLGAWAAPHLLKNVHGADTRAASTMLITLGTALLLLMAGEYAGMRLKSRTLPKKLNRADNGLGGAVSALSLLLAAWMAASILAGAGLGGLPSARKAIHNSHIITQLNKMLPPAPEVVARLSRLIDPNGFPDVFMDNEPVPRTPVNLPSLGDMAAAVKADRDSVVRIKGAGCGGIVSGSGFVVRPGLVVTNAHVVAGIHHPYVQDTRGSHEASAIWFDPDLDFAVLKVDGLSGKSLKFDGSTAWRDTPVAVLGYPGGGNFDAKAGVVLDQIRAYGRDIYGSGGVVRDVYEVHTDIVPGNSGGPLVGKDGRVIGIVFAESTSYKHVGYALMSDHLDSTVSQAAASGTVVGTGACAE